jgi:hypothetical protein
VTVTVNIGPTSLSWDKQIGNTWNDDSGKVVACSNGDVLVVGGFRISYNFGGGTRTPVSGEDGFLVRYTSNGTYLWDKQLGGTGEDLARAVIETSDGNIIVAGDFYNTLNLGGGDIVGYSSSGKDFFVVKYSSSGSFIWQKHFSCASGAYVRGLAPDHDGGFYMIGSIYGGDLGDGQSSNGTFLARYDSNGNDIWIKTFQTESGSTLPRGVAKLSTNEVVVMVTHYYGMNMGGGMLYPYVRYATTIYLGKYAYSDGSHQWSERFGGPGTANGWAVAGLDNGRIAVAGGMSGQVDLGGGSITSIDATDAFVVCYDNSGTYIWANHYGMYGNNRSNYCTDVTYGGSGNVVVTGGFSGYIDFGGGTFYGTSSLNAFVASYSTSSGAHQWSDWFGETGYGTMVVTPTGVAVTNGLAVVTGTFDSGAHPIDFGSGQRTSLGGTDIFVVADPMTW